MAKTYAGWPYSLCQIGKEVTPGTQVAATNLWRGVFASADDDRKRDVVQEDVGLLVAGERSYDSQLGAKLAIPATAFTYQQACILLESCIGKVTASGTGTYVRAYSFPLSTTPNVLQSYTLRLGNQLASADQKLMPFALANEIEFSGKAGELWQMSGSVMGQRLVNGTFTAAIGLPAVNEAIFANTNLYIDASGGTIGTTQLTGVLVAASVKINNGIVWVPPGDGTLYPLAYKFAKEPEVTFTLTLELAQDTGVSDVATQRGIYENNTLQLFRLQCPGAGVNTFNFDLAGKYDKVGGYNKEGDGDTTVQFQGHASYSSADSLFFLASISNALATLP